MTERLDLRPMTREEADRLVGWATDEGWNPGIHDADIFWRTDAEGFIAAELDGELIGGGTITCYGGEFGFMGLFIVEPAFRGRGLGTELWHARKARLHERLRPGAGIGMDGVYAMVEWYAKGGFVFAHRDIRFEGVAAPAAADGIVPVVEVPFATVAEYDGSCFPAPRERFLRAWLEQPDSLALAAWDGITLRGYGVARTCGVGSKVGPLFADDAATAEALFRGLGALRPGEPVFLDVPEINEAAMTLAARHEMQEVFGCARMYVGDPPALRNDRIYGVTTFELG